MRHASLQTLVLCLSLSSAVAALAADRRIEGIVKAVDAEKATITLTTKTGAAAKVETLDVVKKTKITINGQPAALKDVRRGQQAVAVFNTELEVVTKLDATGEGIARLVPEIAVVNELPEPEGHHTGPWPSADGLTLYWKTQPGFGNASAWIWSARRRSKDALFEDAKRLVPGSDMTVTADSLEMILLQGDSLWVTRRPSLEAGFVRPQKIAEFQNQGFIAVPCLSGNDLVLYADRFFPNQPVAPVKSARASRQAKWSKPEAVKVALPAGKRLRFFSVTADGSRAFGVLFEPIPGQAGKANDRNELVTMRAVGDGFGPPELIRVGGEPLRGIFPRYVAATNELFLARIPAEGQRAEIVLVRNFDPDAIETAPAGAAANSTQLDREAMQGEWLCVSETANGSPYSPEQLKKMNRRLSVQGDRFVVRREGDPGKPVVYDGTIQLDPSAQPKAFDWTGKGPDGASVHWRGIYQLQGDLLQLCYVGVPPETPRPNELRSDVGSKRRLVVFKRESKLDSGTVENAPAASRPTTTNARPPEPDRPAMSSKRGAGQYYEVDYPSPDRKEPHLPLRYILWIPNGVSKLRGIIVHTHGNGAYEAGARAAYDLQWQALAKKWDFALLAPSYVQGRTKAEQDANWHRYFVPGGGSRDVFLEALHELAEKSNHPELERVPWCLWGHSAGAIWSGLMHAHDPERIVAIWLRSGSGWGFAEGGFIPNWRLVPTKSNRGVPIIYNLGMGGNEKNPKEEKDLKDALGMLRAFRPKDAPVGVAVDPLTGHNCGDCRLLAIPFFDTMLAMRLPEKGSKDQTLKPVNMKLAWLAAPLSKQAVPAAQYNGDPREAAWLPNERFARKWMEYVETGYVTDTTPPPAPFNVRVASRGRQSNEITWEAEADLESGLRTFIVFRDGERIGRIPPRPSDGSARPMFQGLSYHDTPMTLDAEMRYLDEEAPRGARHTYTIIAVNSAGLNSKPVSAGRR